MKKLNFVRTICRYPSRMLETNMITIFCRNIQDELSKSIRLLNTLAQKFRAKRMEAGALNLASPEVKIHLDSSESSDPIDVEQKELRETNSLVEEFMLLANISVARKIEQVFPQTAVLRCAAARTQKFAHLQLSLDGICHLQE
jgi:exoribonuclease R